MALAKPPALGRTLAIRSQGWRAAGASLHCWLKLVGGCGAGGVLSFSFVRLRREFIGKTLRWGSRCV